MSFQTPGGPAAKRRRIDAANVTLRKPFRSPLVTRQQTTETGADSAQNSPSTHRAPPATGTASCVPATPVPTRSSRPAAAATAPSPLHANSSLFTTVTANTPQPKRLANPASRSTRASWSHTPASNSRRDPTPSKPKPGPKPNTHSGGQEQGEEEEDENDDADLLAQILASQRHLTTHLRTTQQELELVRQARRIEEASRARRSHSHSQFRGQDGQAEGQAGEEDGGEENDAGLGAMVAKWKGASRLAAEELFGLIRGRVDGMGGAKAWRESRRPRVWDDGAFGEGSGKGRGDGDGDGDGDGNGEGEGEEEEEEEESGETVSYSVGMMRRRCR